MDFQPKERDFLQGYWYYRPKESFPPPAVFNLDSSYSKSRLCLAGTPDSRDLSDYRIRKVITGWADILPKLNSVKVLWVAQMVSQDLFDAICSMPNLQGLWLKHTSIEHIESVAMSNIQYLSLGSSTKLASLDPLINTQSLLWLETENLKKVTDFSALSNLKNLVGLGINGSMWTTQRVNSLKPISKLSNLRYLALANTRVLDKSLKPLHKLEKLQTLHMAKWWPKKEVSDLLQAKPELNLK